jgi:ferredoxin
MATCRLYAPVRRRSELVFDVIQSPDEVALDYANTRKAPKAILFPQTECLLTYGAGAARGDLNALTAPPLDTTPTIILGLRPCDARAFLLLDAVFLQGDYSDPYYQARRESTLVVSLACARPRATCFCHALGSGPYDRNGSDVMLRESEQGYLVEAVSARGARLLETLGEEAGLVAPDAEPIQGAAAIEAHALSRLAEVETVAGIDDVLPDLFDELALWRDISEKCLACGTCTYICPACHCFNITDRVEASGGLRLRAWDACMYASFTLHASGHNPRPDQATRWRQRVMHKFSYLPENVGLFGCVGCGRCVLACPVSLDIREALRLVRQAAERAAAREE